MDSPLSSQGAPMPEPPVSRAKGATLEEFVQNLCASGLLGKAEVENALRALSAASAAPGEEALAGKLVGAGLLTAYQAELAGQRRFSELRIGNYEVLDRLGAGGMGRVYKARHRRMKRVVALKVLARSVNQSKTFVQRFQREVEAVARLSHPNIVVAHHADEAQLGSFLVMEFVDGRDLAAAVLERGPQSIPEAVECILQAARGLHYAHLQGVIHRDIKPANLLRDGAGVVKVADLGLARCNDAIGRPAAPSTLTQANMIVGTVDFMSPEQTLGMRNLDNRTDIYSLGCTLHYLLIGRPPYDGTLLEILLKHREAPIPSLCATRGDVPATLDQIFQLMVAKKPEERFASMAEVVRALEALAIVPERPPKNAPHPPAVGTPTPTSVQGARKAERRQLTVLVCGCDAFES